MISIKWQRYALMTALLGTLLILTACHRIPISSLNDPAPAQAQNSGVGTVRPATITHTPVPSPTMTATPTVSPSATFTPTPTATRSPSPTATATLSPTVMPTATATASPTATPTPGPTPDGKKRTLRVPILMYHYLSHPPAGANKYRVDLSVTPERFAQQLDYLAGAGYHVITLDDLVFALTQGRPLPPKPVILTFDDGYEDFYQNAFPILQAHHMTAIVFLITDFLNSNRPGYMSWAQVKVLKQAGIKFGAHSRNHADLRRRSTAYLVWQALGCTESFQAQLGEPARYIAYPSGRYDQHVVDVFHSAGYWAGLTTRQGKWHSSDRLFDLRRVRIRYTTTLPQFIWLLEHDW